MDTSSEETTLNFRPMIADDWKSVSEIYLQGIETGNATFQHKLPSWDEWDNNHLKSCRIIAEKEGTIVGWAALSPVSSRQVYSGVAEVSVYVSNSFKGKKAGTKLLQKLVEESEHAGIWTLQASIFPENEVSLYIHSKSGFRLVGIREKIGKMDGVWRDTLLLERRSKITEIGIF